MEILITVLGSLVLIGAVFAMCLEFWKNNSEMPDSKTSKDPDDQSDYLDAIETAFSRHSHLVKDENYPRQLIMLRDQEFDINIAKEEISHQSPNIMEPEEVAEISKQIADVLNAYGENRQSVMEFIVKMEKDCSIYNEEKMIWLEEIIADNDHLLKRLEKICAKLVELTGASGGLVASIATGVFSRHA